MSTTLTDIASLTVEVRSLDQLPPSSTERLEWENLVANNPWTGFMQRLDWAKFKSAMGQIARLIIVRDDQKIIAGTLVYAGRDERKPTIMVAPYGPVLPWGDLDLARRCLRLILDKAEETAMQLNAVSLRIEPRIPHPVPSLLSEFGTGPVNLVPAETLYLDLTLSEEELLRQMKPKCRYNISLSNRRGVQVREMFLHNSERGELESSAVEAQEQGARSTCDILYEMLEEAAGRDDFYLEPKNFFDTLLNELASSGQNNSEPNSSSMLKVFVAEHEGETLGALVMIVEGKRATYLYGGISNKKRNVMPGYALQWHAIKEAMKLGCQTYDFYGFDQFKLASHSYARFSRFKSGFGGNPMRFIGAQDFVFMDRLVDNVIVFLKDAGID